MTEQFQSALEMATPEMKADAVYARPAHTVPSLYDHVFDRWADGDLVWLPERGMGRLKINSPAPYDASYFAKYEEYAATELGRQITAARIWLVNQFHQGYLIDVGIGCGSFIEARNVTGSRRPPAPIPTARAPRTFGFDINVAGLNWLMERGLYRNPYVPESVEAVSLWDVIEHIPDPGALLQRVSRWVFVSLPLWPGDGPPDPTWRHYRPDEHCWYWTRAGFIAWMNEHGFVVASESRVETTMGRQDIGTFAFRRLWRRSGS